MQPPDMTRHTAVAVLLLVATPAALALKAPPDVHITADRCSQAWAHLVGEVQRQPSYD